MKTLPCTVCKTPVPVGMNIGRPLVFCDKHVREGWTLLPALFRLTPKNSK